jgi:hypothetical protein
MNDFIVYKLTDRTNGLIYIGYTCMELDKRWTSYLLRKRFSHCDFDKEILLDNLSWVDAGRKEREMILEYNSNNSNVGYNENEGGSGPGHQTEEAKRKIGESRKGIPQSEDHVRNRSEALKGRKLSEENKRNLSKSRMGKLHIEESKKKMSDSRRGKKHSEETKRKMSEAQTGEKHAMFGKNHSKETRMKMRKTEESKITQCVNMSPLSENDVIEIRQRASNGESSKSISLDFPISRNSILRIIRRERWKHI